MATKCGKDGCSRNSLKMGLCQYHARKVQRGLERIEGYDFPLNPSCEFDKCDNRAAYAKGGYCLGHRYQTKNGIAPRPLVASDYFGDEDACQVTFCRRAIQSYGLCVQHASVAWRFNLTHSGLVELLSDWSCALCGSSSGAPNIDHDHSCCDGNFSCGHCIRGVLCHGCNGRLGAVEKNPDLYAKSLQYIASNHYLPSSIPVVRRYEGAGSSHPMHK